MSLAQIAQDLIADRWPAAHVHLRHYGPHTERPDGTAATRCVIHVWRWEHPASETETIAVTLALVAGDNSAEAWRALVQTTLACDDDAPAPLTTEQAAAVLGVGAGRVRQFVIAGTLVPLPPGRQNGVQAWFAPGDVWRLLEGRVAALECGA